MLTTSVVYGNQTKDHISFMVTNHIMNNIYGESASFHVNHREVSSQPNLPQCLGEFG